MKSLAAVPANRPNGEWSGGVKGNAYVWRVYHPHTLPEVKAHMPTRARNGFHGELPELLTAKELELLFKIDVKTIYSYVRRGLIPYVRIQSNVRFRKEEIFDWIERQTFRPRSYEPSV